MMIDDDGVNESLLCGGHSQDYGKRPDSSSLWERASSIRVKSLERCMLEGGRGTSSQDEISR